MRFILKALKSHEWAAEKDWYYTEMRGGTPDPAKANVYDDKDDGVRSEHYTAGRSQHWIAIPWPNVIFEV